MGLFASQFEWPVPFLSTLGTELMAAVGATAVGVLLGFLFGIPRAVDGAQPSGAAYRANTNLEQISDWLTKIIIGVSLIELSSLSKGFGKVVDGVADGIGGGVAGRTVAAGLLLYFSIIGFINGWLAVRLYLQRALSAADEVRDTIEDTRGEIDAIADQPDVPEDIKERLRSMEERLEAAAHIAASTPVSDRPPPSPSAIRRRLENRWMAFHTRSLDGSFRLMLRPPSDWFGTRLLECRVIGDQGVVGKATTTVRRDEQGLSGNTLFFPEDFEGALEARAPGRYRVVWIDRAANRLITGGWIPMTGDAE